MQRRPWLAAGAALVVLLGLAIPALSLRLGSSDAGVDPEGTTTRKAYDLIADGFGAGTNGSFLLVAELGQKGDKAAAQQVADAVKGDDDFTFVSAPAISPDGQVATITAYPKTGPQDEATTDTLDRLRDDVLPGVESRHRHDRRGGRLHRVQRGLLERGGRQAPAVHRRGRAPERAAAARGVPLGRDPDQGGDHEPALDRRRARAS